MRNDQFSAIVVTYFTGPVLHECLTALLGAPLCGQVILVNNGNPAEVLAALNQLAQTNPKLNLLHGHGNIGFGAGCNLGAKTARLPKFLFVNPDCVIGPDTLDAFDAALAQYPNSIIGGAIFNPDGSEQRGGRRGQMSLWSACVSFLGLGRAGEQAGIWRDFNRTGEPFPADITPMPTISGALLSCQNQTFAALGGFDEAYFLHVEDVDLCQRARALDHPVLFAPTAKARHIGSSSAVSRYVVESAKIRSFFYYFWTNAKGLQGQIGVLVAMPLLALAIMARMLVSQALAGLAKKPLDQSQA